MLILRRTHLDVVVVVAQIPQGEVGEERDVDGWHGGQSTDCSIAYRYSRE